MREEKFTGILGEISEEYINEVFSEEKKRKTIPLKKWITVAACLCILAISTTTAIAKISNIFYSVEQNVTVKTGPRDRNVSYYDVSFNLEPIDDEELSKELLEYFKEDGKPLAFDSAAEATEYIGFEKLVVPDLGLEPDIQYFAEYPEVFFQSGIWLMGKDGKLERADLLSYYKTENNNAVLCTASIYTDNYDIKQGIVSHFQHLDVFSDIKNEERTNKNGTEYLVVYVPVYSGVNVRAFLVKDNIEYTIQTHCFENDDHTEIEEIILRWANSF